MEPSTCKAFASFFVQDVRGWWGCEGLSYCCAQPEWQMAYFAWCNDSGRFQLLNNQAYVPVPSIRRNSMTVRDASGSRLVEQSRLATVREGQSFPRLSKLPGVQAFIESITTITHITKRSFCPDKNVNPLISAKVPYAYAFDGQIKRDGPTADWTTGGASKTTISFTSSSTTAEGPSEVKDRGAQAYPSCANMGGLTACVGWQLLSTRSGADNRHVINDTVDNCHSWDNQGAIRSFTEHPDLDNDHFKHFFDVLDYRAPSMKLAHYIVKASNLLMPANLKCRCWNDDYNRGGTTDVVEWNSPDVGISLSSTRMQDDMEYAHIVGHETQAYIDKDYTEQGIEDANEFPMTDDVLMFVAASKTGRWTEVWNGYNVMGGKRRTRRRYRHFRKRWRNLDDGSRRTSGLLTMVWRGPHSDKGGSDWKGLNWGLVFISRRRYLNCPVDVRPFLIQQMNSGITLSPPTCQM
ncbi:hypothetical protein QBC40DRAFT_302438 [Triangularia verruculosa]|uniref:Uncharacterized protein n=1 Tax=Triangularia verruculosa TaxID=2587418 RepID=A0AAN6X613_9PEZI|nr:hypothetical protein QBC40DRAFT_302438 [Triangularia verruculosa]